MGGGLQIANAPRERKGRAGKPARPRMDRF